jgi:Patatin-like phospholipase
MSTESKGAQEVTLCKTFDDVFRAELADIRERHNRTNRPKIPDDPARSMPTTALGLTGLACSGGGIRSAAFCLGVLQGLQSKDVIRNMDYLSTVSGGGYIATTMTIGMSSGGGSSNQDGTFPFGRLDDERREPPEVRHLRDNSRYLLQNGWRSAVSAVVIYLRGIAMNLLVLLPILLVAAALLVSLNPDTRELTINEFLALNLTNVFGNTRVPFTVAAASVVAALLVVYAVLVSVVPIAPLKNRQRAAQVAGWISFIGLLVVVVELHTVLLRLVFEAQGYIKYPEQAVPTTGAQVFKFIYESAKTFVLMVTPLVVVALPFIKTLAAKAVEGGAGDWGDLAKRIASRVILVIAASVVPLLLWLAMMQLAFWGTAVSTCPGSNVMLTCARDQVVNGWPHAPPVLQWLFGQPIVSRDPAAFHWMKVPILYGTIALVLIALWPFLSVNSNSLHQLYRDRLGSAFLIRRRALRDDPDERVDPVDRFCLTEIEPKQAPYHLINSALNVPGSPFANRRGRNADFFLFSRRYIGSEATGYVETEKAEKVVDGLNIGTAMAISGAAAAPNMGMASVRPLSPTIAFLNVRLGRWVRHPRDIENRVAKLEKRQDKKSKGTERQGQLHLSRIPGPLYLLFEAFSKSGRAVRGGKKNEKRNAFVFLTDGGHIDNTGIYELLRRRCRLIISIDAEADPNFNGAALIQVERFARIDLNVLIRMNWMPIGTRTLAVSEEMRKKVLKAESGPHVAVGLIDYPPAPGGTGKREKGVLIYINPSLSGDENDYVIAYKAAYPRFPHETTADQLFSEEQFEAYRALGEHIARRFLDGRDEVVAFSDDRAELLEMIQTLIPGTALR